MELPEWINVLCDLLLFTGMALVYISEALILTFIPRRYRAKSIKGEVALVTGGAGGIGRLIAMKLAKLGAHVVIWDINRTGLEDTAEEIRRSGGKCWSYYCDITNRKEVYRIAKTVQIEIGPVTLLINNAGYVYGKTLLDLPDDEIERTYRVNILSHYWTHGYDGIHATLVCPYFINTGMFHGVKPRLMPMLEPDYVAEEVVSGILVNQINVVLPGSVRYLLPLKCLLPAKLCWALMYHIIKGPQSMMMLKGKEEKILKNNNNIAVISKETRVL